MTSPGGSDAERSERSVQSSGSLRSRRRSRESLAVEIPPRLGDANPSGPRRNSFSQGDQELRPRRNSNSSGQDGQELWPRRNSQSSTDSPNRPRRNSQSSTDDSPKQPQRFSCDMSGPQPESGSPRRRRSSLMGRDIVRGFSSASSLGSNDSPGQSAQYSITSNETLPHEPNSPDGSDASPGRQSSSVAGSTESPFRRQSSSVAGSTESASRRFSLRDNMISVTSRTSRTSTVSGSSNSSPDGRFISAASIRSGGSDPYMIQNSVTFTNSATLSVAGCNTGVSSLSSRDFVSSASSSPRRGLSRSNSPSPNSSSPHSGNARRSMRPDAGEEMWQVYSYRNGSGIQAQPVQRSISFAHAKEVILRCTSKIVSSYSFTITMMIFTIFALYGDDIRLASFEKEDDQAFVILISLCIFMFTLEICMSCLVLPDYPFSFFCYLDIVAALSLVLDLPFIWEALIGDGEDGEAGFNEEAQYARAGRSSRMGTRLVRILRVIRLVRLKSFIKFCLFTENGNGIRQFRFTRLRNQEGEGFSDRNSMYNDAMSVYNREEEEEEERQRKDPTAARGKKRRPALQPSAVGKKLSERTTLWLVLLALAMLVMVPLLDASNFETMARTSAEYGADVVSQTLQNALTLNASDIGSISRRIQVWQEQLLTYIVYHNSPFATCPQFLQGGVQCSADLLAKLSYFGLVSTKNDAGANFFASTSAMVSGPSWDGAVDAWRQSLPVKSQYFVGQIPDHVYQRLRDPWAQCAMRRASSIYGVSLMQHDLCPWTALRIHDIAWYMSRIQCNQHGCYRMAFFFDTGDTSKWQAVMSMCHTTFLIFVLAIGALVFTRDAERIVLQPLEGIMAKLDMLRKDPLSILRMADKDVQVSKVKRVTFAGLLRRGSIGGEVDKAKKEKQIKEKRKRTGMMETVILENTLIKLATLLALGFGEAGTDIIGENMYSSDASVNCLVPGRSVVAIYGYCHINNFSVTIEVLQENTMVFVNAVAQIVHSTVDEYLGSANRNLGEAFLLVWRLDRYEAQQRRKIADMSILSLIHIIVAVNRDFRLGTFSQHPLLISKMPGYSVSLSFSLNLGHSVSGAIGSDFKIDASYLSSHVNATMQLEGLCLAYGVHILLTESLVRACSELFLQFHFRVVDKILMEGTKSPFRVFTVDLDTKALRFLKRSGTGSKAVRTRLKKKQRQGASRLSLFQQVSSQRAIKQDDKREKLSDDYSPYAELTEDTYINIMRKIYTKDLFQKFEKGYLNYEAGEWDVAAKVLRETSLMLPDHMDGPSCALLDFMGRTGFRAPANWHGFRKYSEAYEATDRAFLLIDQGHHSIGSEIAESDHQVHCPSKSSIRLASSRRDLTTPTIPRRISEVSVSSI